jgi:hypothetical protein
MGETWVVAAYVSEFPDWQSALQFEWRWKQLTRKQNKKHKPIERRIYALKELLALPSSTSKARPFSEWIVPPQVHLEIEETRQFQTLF